MRAGVGDRVTGPDDIVAGPDRAGVIAALGEAEARAFYCAVMGLADPGHAPADLPGLESAEGLELARLVLAYRGTLSAKALRARLGALGVLAASRVRAAAEAEPGLRQATGEVELLDRTAAHAGFFGLDVARIRHRRFDGTLTPPLNREIFLVGDAVTVLPYDPVRDRVLVIEQMRMGPWGRGDPLPWQIEAIAGRIDAGETPEAAARREAVEEADLRLGRLERVGAYYPSPGAVSEHVYSYVAICDLPDDAAGVFGAADEAEDIRGQVLSFDALMDAVARGWIGNAPLLLTAFWLDRERERLRRGA